MLEDNEVLEQEIKPISLNQLWVFAKLREAYLRCCITCEKQNLQGKDTDWEKTEAKNQKLSEWMVRYTGQLKQMGNKTEDVVHWRKKNFSILARNPMSCMQKIWHEDIPRDVLEKVEENNSEQTN